MGALNEKWATIGVITPQQPVYPFRPVFISSGNFSYVTIEILQGYGVPVEHVQAVEEMRRVLCAGHGK